MLLRRYRETPDVDPAFKADTEPFDGETVEDETSTDPGDYTVDQVLEYLAIASPEKRAELIEQEKAGKARKTILEWVAPIE